MKRRGLLLGLVSWVGALVFVGAMGLFGPRADAQQGPPPHALARVIAVQERHTERLMSLPDVVGTAVGLDEMGRPVVKVYVAHAGVRGIPSVIDGEKVEVEVTGEIYALGALAALEKAAKPSAVKAVNPRGWFDRPVPIGVSTGNANEGSAGTIACRVTAGTNVYALSCNHVYARTNSASLGEAIWQPGPYDVVTSSLINSDLDFVIGTLAAFVPIDFSSSGKNYVDAAIALVGTNTVGTSTPSGGYGTPSSETVAAQLNMSVKKYGRTTGLTYGTISGLNATVTVDYGSGQAKFVGQITVTGRRFIQAGDSGSLLVTRTGNNPVGLLFAGSSNGSYAVANPIDLVLDELERELGDVDDDGVGDIEVALVIDGQ